MNGTDGRDVAVLRNKRDASRYQILVAIAARQPAVSQQEIAEAVGVTAQAVSEYVRELVEGGHVEKHGRGRYEVTKEGVDWLISRTDDLREFTEFVTEEVVGQVDADTALADDTLAPGDTVSLRMHEGVLHAAPGSGSEDGGATARALTAAEAGEDVGVAEFDGLLDYETGAVTVVVLPDVREGGSRAVSAEEVATLAADHDLLATAGVEALAAARRVDRDPDVRFGTPQAVQEAATRGLSVLLLVGPRELATHTDRLREGSVGYELVDAR
ncbi:MarR family transcriptional regulator [Halomarina rubra]|uniref:MarR family transcriptional regulator n=1 Tax=Halomarina rubra TaxID=2071873 RepID=A0ABD6ASD5_9EURY|nr:MarR family transcriptional regulator [Halomarina rubra]